MNKYNIDEHIHRFAVWTAARATSKSRLSNIEIADLIETVGLRKRVEILRGVNPLTDSYYHQWIKETGNDIVKTVKETVFKKTKKENFKTNNFTFGLAAKVISIYIKTVDVIPSRGESALSIIAYPPIDSILLKCINLKYGLDLKHQWSTFDWDKYEEVILKIKKHFDNTAMWKIEENWDFHCKKEEGES